jgi:hypothetical protein
MLHPGEDIRPHLSRQTAKALVHRLYGLKDVTIEELDGYDDKNYHVKVSLSGWVYIFEFWQVFVVYVILESPKNDRNSGIITVGSGSKGLSHVFLVICTDSSLTIAVKYTLINAPSVGSDQN